MPHWRVSWAAHGSAITAITETLLGSTSGAAPCSSRSRRWHDWPDSPVPKRVWELLQLVLEASRPGAVILEVQGRAHHSSTRVLSRETDLEMVLADLETATRIWDRCYGHGSRQRTRKGCGS